MTQKQLTQQAEQYFINRMLAWKNELATYDEQTLKTITRLLTTMQLEVADTLEREAGEFAKLTDWQLERKQELSLWLDEVLAGTKQEVTSVISSNTLVVGQASLEMYNNMLSHGGLAKNVNTVGFTAEQFRTWFNNDIIKGESIGAWINRSFDMGAKQTIYDSIITSGIEGKGTRQAVNNLLQTALAEGIAITEREATTTLRVFMQSANVGAMGEVYDSNKSLIKEYQWVTARDSSVCVLCMGLSDKLFKKREDMPLPRHPRCLVGETPVFAPDKISAFISTYRGSVFEITLSSGARFTSTANHMFLSSNGFVPANLVAKGDDIVYSPSAIFDASNPNNDGNISSIYDSINSLSKAFSMTTIRVPASSEDLHGDGEFIKGDIEVVYPKSLLRGDFETFFSEFFEHLKFVLASSNSDNLTPLSLSYLKLFCLFLSSESLVRGNSVLDVFGLSPLAHHQSVSGGIITSDNFVEFKNSSNNIPCNTKMRGNGIFRNSRVIHRDDSRVVNSLPFMDYRTKDSLFFQECINDFMRYIKRFSNARDIIASFVRQHNTVDLFSRKSYSFHSSSHGMKIDKVVSVKERQFTGDVYDFQTLTTLYHVNGAVSSNCRCLSLPKIKPWRELGIDIDDLPEVEKIYSRYEQKPIGKGGERKLLSTIKTDNTYEQWFKTLPAKEQAYTLGAVRTKLLNENKIKWDDILNEDYSLRLLKDLGFSLTGKPL